MVEDCPVMSIALAEVEFGKVERTERIWGLGNSTYSITTYEGFPSITKNPGTTTEGVR